MLRSETMTAHARLALADCKCALADFINGANTQFQRSRWVALVTLLRTVGHVLDKVDYPDAPPEIQQRIKKAWEELKATEPEPRIFHEFIEAERNLVIKMYEIRVRANITFKPGPAHLLIDWQPVQLGGIGGAPTTIEAKMLGGTFKGRDLVELVREAITFWRDFLNKIDSEKVSD